jgi:hypothetical protein
MTTLSKIGRLLAVGLICVNLAPPALAQRGEPSYREGERNDRLREEYQRGYDDGYSEGYRKGLDEGRAQAAPPPPPPPVRYIRPIVIQRATYGIERRSCDAAPAIASRVSGQDYAIIEAGNDLCGDPAREVKKRLEVRYSCGGGPTKTAFANERDSVILDCRR